MAPSEAVESAKRFARIAQELSGERTQDYVVRQVVELASIAVEGAVFAGVTILDRGGMLRSVAYTDELVHAVDLVQVEHGQGPCLDASREPCVLRIEDMAREERWPRFARRARELGVGSMVSCSLPAGRGNGTRGALNLHAPTAGAFGPESAELAHAFALHAAIALDNAAMTQSLRTALGSRQRIGEATGMMMERRRVSSAQAFGLLVSVSQRLNVKLRDLAEHVVLTGQDPLAIDPEDFPSGCLR
ncbi:MAG TPA: ANTAR domain-containing protein [Actinocrinis sp.]|nr:ANTAR domain-containing protein [Actinocrinis sp.]